MLWADYHQRLDPLAGKVLAITLWDNALYSFITRWTGYDELAKNMPSHEMTMFSRAVRVQSQTGGDLARVLETLATPIRDRRRVVRTMVRAALEGSGFSAAILEEVLSPPWTSDWLTAAGRTKLRSFGIAPPEAAFASPPRLWPAAAVSCPRCGSWQTERLSEFGSTPCKAHYRCGKCREPFDYFKCL